MSLSMLKTVLLSHYQVCSMADVLLFLNEKGPVSEISGLPVKGFFPFRSKAKLYTASGWPGFSSLKSNSLTTL